LLAAESRSLLNARRRVKALHHHLRNWLTREETYPVAVPPLSSLASPAYSVVTGQPLRGRFNHRSFLKNTFQLACFAFLLSVGARLSLWSIGYALGVVVGVCVLDQLPKLFRHVSKEKARQAAMDDGLTETRPLPARGAWVESET
jgi:hypothetical protein